MRLSRKVKGAFACFGLAFLIERILIGYQTIVLLLLGFGALLLFLQFTPWRWLRRLVLGLAGCGVLILALVEIPIVMASWGEDRPADYLIVLGAGVNGETPSRSLRERLQAAEAYLKKYPDCTAVVSGGRGAGEDISEAEAMRRYLIGAGIAPQRIVMEEKAANTRENLRFSLALITENTQGEPSGPIAIVSSEYHLYRARYLASQMEVESIGVAAATTEPILRLNYFIREAAAVLRLWTLGY